MRILEQETDYKSFSFFFFFYTYYDNYSSKINQQFVDWSGIAYIEGINLFDAVPC